jgi:deazaflavin-dependent oxidoreductase (nitroreductase family)
MPNDLTLKGMNLLHRVITTVSFGRLGWSALGMPVLELTTTGRKSGQPRTVFLTSPLEVDGNPLVVASRGGDDQHPAWYLNLRDDPDVRVAVRGTAPQPMVARIAEGEERARLWDQLTRAHDNYAGYQRKTDRTIPVVVLERPADNHSSRPAPETAR